MSLFFYQLLRAILFPIIWIYTFSIKDRRRRYRLERRLNQKRLGFQAKYAFEISSEGELEQVLSLIEDLVVTQKIELIFSSDSVVAKCEALQEKYPENLKIFAFPFLSYFPWGLGFSLKEVVTAPKIYMCRYDFFPELLEVCRNRELCILAATSKSLENSGVIKSWWYRKFFKRAKRLVASTQLDKVNLQKRFPNHQIETFDFRKVRILQRHQNKEKKYLSRYPEIESLRLKKSKTNKNLIFGSMWEQDLDYIHSDIWDSAVSGELTVYICPHDLSSEHIERLISKLPKTENIVIETTRGILCELYTEFDNAYVGGGYEGSPGVHSLLEPYLAGCQVYCGPQVDRSTEYQSIKDENGSLEVVTKKEPLSCEWLGMASAQMDSKQFANTEFFKQYKNIRQFIGS